MKIEICLLLPLYFSNEHNIFVQRLDDTVRYRNAVQKYCVRWKNKVVVKAKFQVLFDRIVATTNKKLFYYKISISDGKSSIYIHRDIN